MNNYAKIEKLYGGAEGLLIHQFITLGMSGKPCDICTYSGNRFLEVKIDNTIFTKLMYGMNVENLAKELEEIKLRKGKKIVGTVNFKDIWVINPMPEEGFTNEDLEQVDISEGENIIPGTEDTLREAISKCYHCQNKEEEDYFLKRYLAS